MIDKVPGGLRHVPIVARGTQSAPLAGEGDQGVTPTLRTAGACEAIGPDAAFEITPKLPLPVAGHPLTIAMDIRSPA
jgi:hypothetical protein